MTPARTGRLADLVRPGMRVAVGDGLGAPLTATAELSAAAAAASRVSLLVGWVPRPDPGLDLGSFSDVRALMSGWGLRRPIDDGRVHAVATRLSAIPALVRGPLRPDLLLATVVPVAGGFSLGTEVSWLRTAVDAGATVAAVVASHWPRCDAGPLLPSGQVVVVGECDGTPPPLDFTPPAAEHGVIAKLVVSLIPAGSRLQVGPGPLGTAVLAAVDVPVRVDSGLLPDGVVDLDARGLLVGDPVGTYLAGGDRLFRWADGRRILHGIEFTHDPSRLSGDPPLIAVNTALEVDRHGQVNVEGTARSAVGGIGGHPDYAAAACRSAGGLSIVAIPSRHQGVSTLVGALSRPVSTPAHDVDVLVTEKGAADLRGLDRAERTAAIEHLWAGTSQDDNIERTELQ